MVCHQAVHGGKQIANSVAGLVVGDVASATAAAAARQGLGGSATPCSCLSLVFHRLHLHRAASSFVCDEAV
jgi:hypothetical protein